MEDQVPERAAQATYRITLTRREHVCSMPTGRPLQTLLPRAREIATPGVCTDSQAVSRAIQALEEEKDEICAYYCIEDCAWLVHGVHDLGKFMWMVVHAPRGSGEMLTATSWLSDAPQSHEVVVAHGEITIESVQSE